MGITRITIKDYTLGNIGMLPGCAVFVFFGTSISHLTDRARGRLDEEDENGAYLALFIGGSVVSILGIIWVSIAAKKEIDLKIKKQGYSEMYEE